MADEILPQDETGGAVNDTFESLLRKHLSSAMVGPNWNGLIAALASGDKTNSDNAQAAFDQLFLSTASGRYLDREAANVGLSRPAGVGLSDEVFRSLAIKGSTVKTTAQSILDILQVFYGEDAVRAYGETKASSTFGLTDGDELLVLLDGITPVKIVFKASDFALIGAATASEVAAAITRGLALFKVKAFAVASMDAVSGVPTVRLYSGSLGLGSSVQVTGGRAQLALSFSDRLATYTGNIALADNYSWAITSPSVGVTRFSVTKLVTGLKLNLSTVEEGDYIILEVPGVAVPSGQYTIQAVSVTYAGSNITQSFDIALGDATGAFTQASNAQMSFFRPSVKTINRSSFQSVLLSQAGNGLEVKLPATTNAVGRGPGSASYLHGANSAQTTTVTGFDGIVTVTAPNTLAVGDQIQVDGGASSLAAPPVVLGSPATPGSTGTTSYSLGTIYTQLSEQDVPNTIDGSSVRLSDGRALIMGGNSSPGGILASCQLFEIVSSALINGARQYTYRWMAAAPLPAAVAYGAAITLQDGRVLFTGGRNSSNVNQATCYIYNPSPGAAGSWTTVASMATARSDHTLSVLNDGRVMVTGGYIGAGEAGATNTTEIYNPSLNTWTAGPAMSIARANHQIVKLQDSRFLVIAGNLTLSTYTNTCELYDPTLNSWSRTSNTTYAMAEMGVGVLPNGNVLVVGGIGHPPVTPVSLINVLTAEIYDVASGAWLYTSLPFGTINRPCFLLPVSGNRTILLGGSNVTRQYYDNATGTWSRVVADAPTIGFGRYVVPVGDQGAVLIAGSLTATSRGFLYQPGVDTHSSSGINGHFAVTSATPTTFSYASGMDYLVASELPTFTPFKALASVGANDIGPYVLDPVNGLAITSVVTSLTSDIPEGSNLTVLPVADTSDFPDGEGFVVIGLGTEYEAGPVKYLGIASSVSLLLDYKYNFDETIPAGASVTRLVSKGPLVPTAKGYGASYITGSSLGRVSAQKAIEESVAAGLDVSISVTYPGDAGLGNAGGPVEGLKVSDKVAVWGGDNLDEELAIARGDI